MRITFTGPNYDYFTADVTGAELEVLVNIAFKSHKTKSYPGDKRIVLDDSGTKLNLNIAIAGDTPVMTEAQAAEKDAAAESKEVA